MRVFRIARPKWVNVHTGSGIPARWNRTGAMMLYTSSSIALALLEILVHLKRDQLPDYMWIAADVPDKLVASVDMPSDPAEFGSAWLERRGASVALAVPSVIVPERNSLLNPNHTDFSRIRWDEPEPLKIDPRLSPG
jgi:RES domain-containing protein